MSAHGRRHPLVLYMVILDLWWQKLLGIGLVLLAFVAALIWLPSLLPLYTPVHVEEWIIVLSGFAGAVSLLLAIFLAAARKFAYVQAFEDHLRLATPFLRMNISYRRLFQTSSTEMGRLFPVEKLKGWKRTFMRSLAMRTVIVVEMKGWPLPRPLLNLFLSIFFFPDKNPRLALLVPDWIQFSMELESYRSAWFESSRHPTTTPRSELLASLSRKQ
jgi:hypothetical protein